VSALDNPIWYAATTIQERFAEVEGDAARFLPAVTGLAGLRTPSDEAMEALGILMQPGEVAGLLFGAPVELRRPLERVSESDLVQMVHQGPAPAEPPGLVELGEADAPAMRALAEVTRPGPFGPRTHELGLFLGLREGDELVAMAGQRMRLAGIIEVSAVCTHPSQAGKGLGARLLAGQLARIGAAGAGAMLHVLAENQRAIDLYARAGFRERRRFVYTIVRRQL
jgi:ribosomal protein S18 acetylase RimI-like enzyme